MWDALRLWYALDAPLVSGLRLLDASDLLDHLSAKTALKHGSFLPAY